MKSDKGFSDFIKGVMTPKVGATLALGLVLLLLAGLPTVSESAEEIPNNELTELCSSLQGVGRCRVMTTLDEDGAVSAVAILCDGAESLKVREELYRLVSSLYGIGYNRISVLKISE